METKVPKIEESSQPGVRGGASILQHDGTRRPRRNGDLVDSGPARLSTEVAGGEAERTNRRGGRFLSCGPAGVRESRAANHNEQIVCEARIARVLIKASLLAVFRCGGFGGGGWWGEQQRYGCPKYKS